MAELGVGVVLMSGSVPLRGIKLDVELGCPTRRAIRPRRRALKMAGLWMRRCWCGDLGAGSSVGFWEELFGLSASGSPKAWATCMLCMAKATVKQASLVVRPAKEKWVARRRGDRSWGGRGSRKVRESGHRVMITQTDETQHGVASTSETAGCGALVKASRAAVKSGVLVFRGSNARSACRQWRRKERLDVTTRTPATSNRVKVTIQKKMVKTVLQENGGE